MIGIMKKDGNTKTLKFVKDAHAGQFHANEVPVFNHLARVAKRLEIVLRETNEGSMRERNLIVKASLGHDLIEDTTVSRKDLEKIFGKEGLALIDGMTNTWGDENISPYVEKISSAAEEVRLIKLADLADNLTSVTYNLTVLKKEWVNSYFLPIVTPMTKAVLKTKFIKYKKSGTLLQEMVRSAFFILLDEMRRY